MPLEKSEAIILKSFNWSESSRMVIFFTEEFGKLKLTDRGGRSMKTRRGRLTTFARLDITFYLSEKQTSGYISDSDLLELYSFERDGTLGRLAYASAACELLYLLLPERDDQPGLYRYVVSYLKLVDTVEKHSLPSVFICFFLRLLSQLGYHPSLAYCVTSGEPVEQFVPEGADAVFSAERGGVVSPPCQRPGEYYIRLSYDCFRRLLVLQTASLAEAAGHRVSFAEAAQMLEAMAKFVRYQADLPANLKSLEFLDKLKKTHLTDR
ncbi:DNA repair protein RecO [bacterium]|nr:DNA repair protein RecO [bacterium]